MTSEIQAHREMMARLATAMTVSDINRAELARRLHLSPATVSEWWTKDAQPSSGALQRMARAARCNLHWLLTGEGSMELPGVGGAALLGRGVMVALAGMEDYIAAEKAKWVRSVAPDVTQASEVIRLVDQVSRAREEAGEQPHRRPGKKPKRRA